MRERNKQIMKEAKVTVILYLIYFAWWYFFAYGMGDKDPLDYRFIMGLPEWFFYSCIVGFFVICTLVYFAIKIFFKEVDFD